MLFNVINMIKLHKEVIAENVENQKYNTHLQSDLWGLVLENFETSVQCVLVDMEAIMDLQFWFQQDGLS